MHQESASQWSGHRRRRRVFERLSPVELAQLRHAETKNLAYLHKVYPGLKIAR
jgi:hypothetical protein